MAVLRTAIAGGVDIVQLREKHLSDDALVALAQTTGALCRQLGALFVVNDRVSVALEAGADGVHLGQQDMPVGQARELLGESLLIGLSTHAPAEIDAVAPRALDRGASHTPGSDGDNSPSVDYVGVGPVHLTPTKPGRPATGLDLVRHAAARAQVPFFAIGGIHQGNAAAVIAAGARRIAVVRAIAEAPNPGHAARELRALLDVASGSTCAETRRA